MYNWVYPVDMWVMLSPDETLLVSKLRVPLQVGRQIKLRRFGNAAFISENI